MFPPESLTYISGGAWWISVSIKRLYLDQTQDLFSPGKLKRFLSEVVSCVTTSLEVVAAGWCGGWLVLGTLWKCHCELSDLKTGYLGRLSSPLWSPVLISNCFALSETFSCQEWRTSTYWWLETLTETTNLLLLSVVFVICC